MTSSKLIWEVIFRGNDLIECLTASSLAFEREECFISPEPYQSAELNMAATVFTLNELIDIVVEDDIPRNWCVIFTGSFFECLLFAEHLHQKNGRKDNWQQESDC